MPQTDDGKRFVWRRDAASGRRYRLFLDGRADASPWPDDMPAAVIRVDKDELDDDAGE